MKIAEHVYALEATAGAYAYLIADLEGATLIDTGMLVRAKAILEEIASLGVEPGSIERILLTHHDVDHLGNAEDLREASAPDPASSG